LKKIDIFSPPVSLHGFDVEGINTAGVKDFWRLPPELHDKVNIGVTLLSKQTAGGRIRFCTDSKKVNCRVVLTEDCLFPHMPLSGSSGVDLFVNGKFALNWRPDVGKKIFQFEYSLNGQKNELCFYLPLCNGVAVFELYVDDGAFVGTPKPYTYTKPVVFYGSSITQGLCASRPSSNYIAEVCGLLDTDFRNLGFSASALGEDNICEYIANLDMSVFVMDYDHNAPTPEYLEATHEKFFKHIREKNPKLPVIMMTRPNFDADIPDSTRRREIVRKTYENAVANGDKSVAFLDGETFFGEALRDRCTPDNIHPTDLGFERMAMAVLPVLKRFLEQI